MNVSHKPAANFVAGFCVRHSCPPTKPPSPFFGVQRRFFLSRKLREHQRPWLYSAVSLPLEQQVDAARVALTDGALRDDFVESIVTYGGNDGFHIECRFVRSRIGDWSYELDCHEIPLQRITVEFTEIEHVYAHIRSIHAEVSPDEYGFSLGDDNSAVLPVVWFHAHRERLAWFNRCLALQEELLQSLIEIHRRLEIPFPCL